MTNHSETVRVLLDLKNSGVAFKDVAAIVGVSSTTISRWFSGAGCPSRQQFRAIEKIALAQWSVVRLWSEETPQAFYVATPDPKNLIRHLLHGGDTSPVARFCRAVRRTVVADVISSGLGRKEAVAIKRALDREARRPHLLARRGGRSHPRTASTGAALSPSPSSAAPSSS